MKYFVSIINDAVNEVMYVDVDCVRDNTLEQLQRKIGGYVDVANYLFPEMEKVGIDCWIADDFVGKPLTLVHKSGDQSVPICGNLVFARHDDEGNTYGFDEMECILVVAHLFDLMNDVVPIRLTCPKEDEARWEAILDALQCSIDDDEEVLAQA